MGFCETSFLLTKSINFLYGFVDYFDQLKMVDYYFGGFHITKIYDLEGKKLSLF